MGIKNILQKLVITSMLVTGVFLLIRMPAFAAGGALRALPQTGNYHTGDTVSVQVTINGGGTALNAAKATVIVSPSFRVQAVTLGDCGFAFVETPTQNNLSFAGVILGGSSTGCTVYTATLQAVSPGVGSITFLNGSVKAYRGASELLASEGNAAYTVTGIALPITPAATLSPTQPPALTTQGAKLYTLLTTIDMPPNVPDSSLKVVLDPNLPTEREVLGTQATFTNPVIFDHVPEGVHVIEVYSYNKLFTKQIVQVGGPNGTLVFGISAHKEPSPWIWYVTIAVAVLTLAAIAFVLYRKIRAKKEISQPAVV